MKIRTLLLLAPLPLALACDVVETDFDRRLLPAVIDLDAAHPPQVELPQSVRVGERFTVRITTYGSGCSSKGTTQVSVTGLQVELSPYDSYPTAEDAACTRELRTHLHQVQVWVEEPGTATVSVHGRRMPDGEPATVARTLTVTAG